MAKTDIVPAEKYAALEKGSAELTEILEANVGGQLNEFDLDRIKIPTGGGTKWNVPTLTGEEDVESLRGVIVYWKEPRAFWVDEFTGGGDPPDCSSPDSTIGTGMYGPGSDGNPSGRCDDCPMSEWGSAGPDKKGQACKQMRVLFMVGPEQMLPQAVVLPPTSIKPIRKYFLRLASRSVPFYGVITDLKLEKTKNAAGISYARVVPNVAERLDREAADEFHAYGQALKENLDRVVMDVTTDASSYVDEDEASDVDA